MAIEVCHVKQAYVTLATNDLYSMAALVLCHSLRLTKTQRKICVMITEGVSDKMKRKLEHFFDQVTLVSAMDSLDDEGLAVLGRPELGCTYTKLHCWTLIGFEKCVFMDADVLVLENVDDLFARDELSAAPDFGWPDCFNSGVFVFVPNTETFRRLVDFAKTNRSFDGADQGILNMFFSDWSTADIRRRLPLTYNCPAFALERCARSSCKILHFLGASKPWAKIKGKPDKTSMIWRKIGEDALRNAIELQNHSK